MSFVVVVFLLVVGKYGSYGVAATTFSPTNSPKNSSDPPLPFLSTKYKSGFTCGDVVPAYYSHSFTFVNKEYPHYEYPQENVICDLNIPRISVEVCQIRLDFEEFEMLGLDRKSSIRGRCDSDVFQVINSSLAIPAICGENKGQHVYATYNTKSSPITLRITLDGTQYSKSSPGRRWRIRGTAIMCSDKKKLAPSGCLQYHTKPYGQIRSFNYGDRIDSGYPVGLRYSICFPTIESFCSIWLYPTVKNLQGVAQFHIGSSFGVGCSYPYAGDYLLLTNLIWGSAQICGKRFPSLEMSYHPFVINFESDWNPGGEAGFSIDFEYRPCNRSGGRAFSLLSTRY